MPTIFRIAKLRVVVYPNDHRPAHVHVVGDGCEAVFNLNCPIGPVELRENYGFHEQPSGAYAPHWTMSSAHSARSGKKFMAKLDEFERANVRAAERLKNGPIAIAARYDRRIGRIVVSLSTGLDIAFSSHDVEGLESAKPADLASIEITPSGLGLHFAKLDADLYIPALLEGFLGSKSWAAGRLGERGGKAKSEAKKTAARANGRLGGRPRKLETIQQS